MPFLLFCSLTIAALTKVIDNRNRLSKETLVEHKKERGGEEERKEARKERHHLGLTSSGFTRLASKKQDTIGRELRNEKLYMH